MAMSKSSFVMLRCAFHQTCKFSNSPEVYVYDIVNLFFPMLHQLAELQVVDFLWNESSSHNNMRVQCPSLGGFAKCETLFNLHHFGYIACSSACMPGSCRVTRSRIQGRLSGYSGYSVTVVQWIQGRLSGETATFTWEAGEEKIKLLKCLSIWNSHMRGERVREV